MDQSPLTVEHEIAEGFSVREKGMPGWDCVFTMTPREEDVVELGADGREWQLDAFAALDGSPYTLVAAFCGSGKSTLAKYLAASEMIRSDLRQRQLFTVPQSHIADGFTRRSVLIFNDKKYIWHIGDHNFCDYGSPRLVSALKDWLLYPTRRHSLDDRVLTGFAVCTHKALGLAWNEIQEDLQSGKITPAQFRNAFDDLSIRIDEAHHISGVFDSAEDDLSEEEQKALNSDATTLGRVCHYMFNRKHKNSRIHLSTATPYRGDCGIWLTPSARQRFKSYYLSWIDHWRWMRVGEFEIVYEFYDRDPIELIVDRILSEPEEYHLVIVPPKRSRWRNRGDEYLRLLELLEQARSEGKFTGEINDLVTKDTQSDNRSGLLAEPKTGNEGPPRFRVIVACMLGREGTDWVPCSRLHNAACEESITLAVQTLGRLFRAYIRTETDAATGEIHGKSLKQAIRVFNYVRRFVEPQEGITKSQLLDGRTNAILVFTQLSELCHPLLVTLPPQPGHGPQVSPKRVELIELLGIQSTSIFKALFSEVEALEVKDRASIYATATAVLDMHPNLPGPRAAILKGLYAAVRRRQLVATEERDIVSVLQDRLPGLKGIDVNAFLEYGNELHLEKDLESRSVYFRGQYGEDYFARARQIIKSASQHFFQMLSEYDHRVLRPRQPDAYLDNDSTAEWSPDPTISARNLKSWAQWLRAKRKKGTLPNYQEVALNETPGWIWASPIKMPGDSFSDEQLLEQLRVESRRRKISCLTRPMLKESFSEERTCHPDVFRQRFGSLPKALDKAGLIQLPTFSKENLIRQLQTEAKRLGRPPRQKDMDRAARAGRSASAYIIARFFGSWEDALESAGFPRESGRNTKFTDASRDDLLQQVRDEYARLGRPLLSKDMIQAGKEGRAAPPNRFKCEFGGYPRAFHLAGVQANVDSRKFYSGPRDRETMIAIIKALKRRLKRIPKIADWNSASHAGEAPGLNALLDVFETWGKALIATGFPARGYHDREALLEQLHNLEKKLGRVPTSPDVLEESRTGRIATPSIFEKVFGGHSKALRAAGMKPLSDKYKEKRDPEVLVQQLRSLVDKYGRAPTVEECKEAQKAGEFFGLSALRRAYGSVRKGFRAAGLEPRAPGDRVKPSGPYVTRPPRAQLIEQLQAEFRLRGRRLKQQDMVEAFREGRAAEWKHFLHRFRSLSAALKAAGLETPQYKSRGRHSREELLAMARALASRLGHCPTLLEWLSAGDEYDGLDRVSRIFGRWSLFLGEAGLTASMQPSSEPSSTDAGYLAG